MLGWLLDKKGIDLVMAEIESVNINKLPVILMGYLNVEPVDKLIQVLNTKMVDAHSAPFVSCTTGTFNGFDISKEHLRRIDYIFFSKEVKNKVLSYDQPILINDGRYPSDHFSVIIRLKLNKVVSY